jgi:hypothetical protein
MILKINIMDQYGVNPQINIPINIEENMIHHINLCRENIITIKLPNYKCILIHTKETH